MSVSTGRRSAEEYCKAARRHWGVEVEDENHYVKGVTFAEDSSRIRVNPKVIAALRSFALSIKCS